MKTLFLCLALLLSSCQILDLRDIDRTGITTGIVYAAGGIVPNAMIRVGMLQKSNSPQDEVGLVAVGEGGTTPPVSHSGRHLPSCILTIT